MIKYDYRSCFNIVNPVLYREACDHATAVNTPNGACIIATAYHYACYEQGVMSTQLPASCGEFPLKRTIDSETFEIKGAKYFPPIFSELQSRSKRNRGRRHVQRDSSEERG